MVNPSTLPSLLLFAKSSPFHGARLYCYEPNLVGNAGLPWLLAGRLFDAGKDSFSKAIMFPYTTAANVNRLGLAVARGLGSALGLRRFVRNLEGHRPEPPGDNDNFLLCYYANTWQLDSNTIWYFAFGQHENESAKLIADIVSANVQKPPRRVSSIGNTWYARWSQTEEVVRRNEMPRLSGLMGTQPPLIYVTQELFLLFIMIITIIMCSPIKLSSRIAFSIVSLALLSLFVPQ